MVVTLRKFVKLRWNFFLFSFSQFCSAQQDGSYLKDLSLITTKNRIALSKCILVDDTPVSYQLYPGVTLPSNSSFYIVISYGYVCALFVRFGCEFLSDFRQMMLSHLLDRSCFQRVWFSFPFFLRFILRRTPVRTFGESCCRAARDLFFPFFPLVGVVDWPNAIYISCVLFWSFAAPYHQKFENGPQAELQSSLAIEMSCWYKCRSLRI